MELGDIYALGSHRLMCGDATKLDDVLRLVNGEEINLVLTDPPYGIKVQNKDGTIGGSDKLTPEDIEKSGLKRGGQCILHQKYPLLIGDDSTDNARKNYEIISSLTKNLIIWGGQYFADFLPVNGGWLFWDKLTGKSDFSDGELAWSSKGKRVRKYVQMWNGVCREGNYTLNPKPRIHPSQKPVELHMQILQDFSKEWDIVLDCFAGSGTTLIACEMTGRKCLTMEISPEYCEIICNRFEKLTGIKPVKL